MTYKPTSAHTTIETDIPGHVKMFHYVRNHHYLKLRDKEGNETKLVEYGLIQYLCEKCDFKFWAECNRANHCPCCNAPELEQVWMKPQLSLVPETESDFKMTVVKEEPNED